MQASTFVFFYDTWYLKDTFFRIVQLELKLNTKLPLDHPPTTLPPTTANILKGSKLRRRLIFDM